MSELDRRSVLKAIAIYTAFGFATARSTDVFAAETRLNLGKPAPFSFDALKTMARRMAAAPYVEPPRPAPEIVPRIDYETWGKIIFNTDYALFSDGRFPVTFFHMGKYFQKSVGMHVVENGTAREIIYDQSYFDMPADSIARGLPKGAGFAGFRVQEPRDGMLDWHKNDWVAFLGGCYFRAIGELYQYGASARGVAVDTVIAGKEEEFPDFTHVYIEKPNDHGDAVTVYCLLDGPSVAGAYKFIMVRDKAVTMDIDAALFVRKPIRRFGLAPLTSMYWFSETVKPTAVDWRPEIHDSDGLAMLTGRGEALWRPLNNPPHIVASAFSDENPKGFGLMQRDRVFDHYLDGVYYDKRPSMWVEPKGNWGKGSVQLIEIPTNDEIRDNIIAAWVPETPAVAGSEFNIAYKLHWRAGQPYSSNLARCVATRLGDGGQPGQPRPKGVRKFLVEFLGGPLVDLPFGVKPEMVMEASRGHFTDYKIMEAVSDGVAGHWRAQFDLAGVEGTDPVEMRLHLTVANKLVTETWLFQYHPF
jgi:glucans biosynthesis protein